MTQAYSTHPLTSAEIEVAYLLVDSAGTGISRADWTSFCKRVTEWRGAAGLHDDVVVAVDAGARLRGVFVMQVIQSLLFGKSLDVPLFVAMSAGDEDGVIAEMLTAVRAKARAVRCTSIRIWTQSSESWQRVTGSSGSMKQYEGVRILLD
jgi:hypothetical protein